MLETATNRVSVWSTSTAKSGINVATTYALQADNIPARIVDASGTEAVLAGSDNTRYRVTITLPRGVWDLGIKESWEVRVRVGTADQRFDVQAVRPIYHPDMIGQVSHVECDCERITVQD